MTQPEQIIIVTGQSGSGKSVVLAALEDNGYYCIDNLPTPLIGDLLKLIEQGEIHAPGVAIAIDARAPQPTLSALPEQLLRLQENLREIAIRSVFLKAENQRLITRFSETRRRHPLAGSTRNISEAIEAEAVLLEPLVEQADLVIDTTRTTVHELRELIRARVTNQGGLSGPNILLQSFGFKHGIPLDTDLLFDVRYLPNPHWNENLRPLSGLDRPVIDYLEQHPVTHRTRGQLVTFIRNQLDLMTATDRSYITCSVGCTGGKHRSVYLTEQLYHDLKPRFSSLKMRHRDLS
ncbi:MAG TPA: RNase adapter RapZ [Halothiobacillaceae bacterium]|nr:RNase adapter RapZ [Halothiobacillaceae bacterium]